MLKFILIFTLKYEKKEINFIKNKRWKGESLFIVSSLFRSYQTVGVFGTARHGGGKRETVPIGGAAFNLPDVTGKALERIRLCATGDERQGSGIFCNV